MIANRGWRLLFFGSMLGALAAMLPCAGVFAWRMWPAFRALREIRLAIEANEPGRFLDAIEAVDKLGVTEAAAEEIVSLRYHPEPRVRMYALMSLTVLRPCGPDEARELIAIFDDPDEDYQFRCAAAACLALFGEQASEAVPSLEAAINDSDDPRRGPAWFAFHNLGFAPTRPFSNWIPQLEGQRDSLPAPGASRSDIADYLVSNADTWEWNAMRLSKMWPNGASRGRGKRLP